MNLDHKFTIDDLLEGCKRGERKVQELLYKTLAAKMLGVCMRYARDRYEAEDILQTAFVKVFQKVSGFRNDGSFEGWIRRIMVNTAMPMALRVGKKGLVLAFDPNPHVFKILTENAGLNKELTNIVPVNLAISAYDGEFFFNSSEATFNNGGISESQENNHGKYGLQQKVKGVNLDNFLKSTYSEYLDRLKVIKIDAEGYDIEIIKSILPVIQKHKPHLIVECFKQLKKQGRDDLYDTIANLGYDLYYMEDFDDKAKLELLKRENMLDRRHFNILAVPVN